MAQEPTNEMRVRFLRSVGLLFCSAGNHADQHAFVYDGKGYCPKHLPPSGPQDPLDPGYCQWSPVHYATEGVRWLPEQQRFLCPDHMAALLREFWRRGDYGRG